jgi:hypothetical protein
MLKMNKYLEIRVLNEKKRDPVLVLDTKEETAFHTKHKFHLKFW